jgi:hypothetical protein
VKQQAAHSNSESSERPPAKSPQASGKPSRTCRYPQSRRPSSQLGTTGLTLSRFLLRAAWRSLPPSSHLTLLTRTAQLVIDHKDSSPLCIYNPSITRAMSSSGKTGQDGSVPLSPKPTPSGGHFRSPGTGPVKGVYPVPLHQPFPMPMITIRSSGCTSLVGLRALIRGHCVPRGRWQMC